MSSLLQFSGDVSEKGIGLQFYLVHPGVPWYNSVPVVTYQCDRCKERHDRIYVAYRKPVDMVGCWVRFRINGKLLAPDLSCPIAIDKVPLGATRLTDVQSSKIWHSS